MENIEYAGGITDWMDVSSACPELVMRQGTEAWYEGDHPWVKEPEATELILGTDPS